MSKKLIDLADAVLDGVGVAGGFEEIERIAEDGWPEDGHLTNDSPELREMIQERAQKIVDDEENDEDADEEEEEEEEEK